MAYPYTPKLQFPLKDYAVNSYDFLEDCAYKGEHWGQHLGEDCSRRAGTQVYAIGRGRVVYSALHPGSANRGNWGNIIIIAHKHPRTRHVFFSLYAHLGKRCKKKGERVEMGEIIGIVGRANTPENGWWEDSHLHFAIYSGPWKGKVLLGYHKKGQQRTQLRWWKKPTEFVRNYST